MENTVMLALLLTLLLLLVFDRKQVIGEITNFDVPAFLQQGQPATLGCTFDDDEASVSVIRWYRSADNITSRSDAFEMQSYDVVGKTWNDHTEGKTTASLDSNTKLITLDIHTVDCKEDDQKYWCYVQVSVDAFQESASTDVCDCPVVTLTFAKGEETITDVTRNSSIQLSTKKTMTFMSKAIAYKPNTPNLITWTVGDNEMSENVRHGEPEPSDSNVCPDLLDVESELTYTASLEDNGKLLCATAALPSCSCSDQFCVKLQITGQRRSLTTGALVGIIVGIVVLLFACVGGAVGVYMKSQKSKGRVAETDEEKQSKEKDSLQESKDSESHTEQEDETTLDKN